VSESDEEATEGKLRRFADAVESELGPDDCVIILTDEHNHVALPNSASRSKVVTHDSPMYRVGMFLTLFKDGNEDLLHLVQERVDKDFGRFMKEREL
jgi:hypothetical protein